MRAFELWAAYAASILGEPVQDAEEKFDALSDKAAWEAVASCAAASTVQPVKVQKISEVQPEFLAPAPALLQQ